MQLILYNYVSTTRLLLYDYTVGTFLLSAFNLIYAIPLHIDCIDFVAFRSYVSSIEDIYDL